MEGIEAAYADVKTLTIPPALLTRHVFEQVGPRGANVGHGD
jgi:hypothetical protein